MTNEPIGNTGKMVPLTIEQLREMDGQPVWITPTGFWALVIAKKEKRVELICNDGETVYADKYIELVGPVYAYPTVRINQEAWGPCESCISCDNCENNGDYNPYEGIYGECGPCYGYSNFKPGNFCRQCGKPLTPEAWDELEKRLGGEGVCVYKSDNGICKKYSTDGVTSYCVDGPCTEEVLSNADKIRSMTDVELSEIFTNYAYEAHGKWYGPDKESYWSESQYALKEWLDWLRQPAKEE